MNSHRPPLPDFSKRLERRRDLLAKQLGLADAHEIDAAIEELAPYLTYAWTFVRDVDRNLSTAKQRTELRRLLPASTRDSSRFQQLDPAVANRVGKYLPGGTQELLYGQPSPQQIRAALRQALADLPRQNRGRPAGTDRLALRQFALGLAYVWAEQTGRPPTRTYDALQNVERGEFRDFVVIVAGVVPLQLRRTRKGGVPSVDHIVRVAIREYQAMIKSKDASRRRGYIDKRLWLGAPKRRRPLATP